MTEPLFRTALTGENSGLRDAFRVIRSARWTGEQVIDPPHRIMGARVPVSHDAREGYWDLCADGPVDAPDLFTVVTRADYATVREEAVVPEGLFEIHLQIEGPTALDTAASGDGAPERLFDQPALILCQAGAQAGYQVLCSAGPRKLVSLYIEPRVLTDLFGLPIEQLGPLARQLPATDPGGIVGRRGARAAAAARRGQVADRAPAVRPPPFADDPRQVARNPLRRR